MWKKQFRIQTHTALKRSDVKKFKEDILKTFTLTPEQANELLPSKKEIVVGKVAGSYSSVFFVDKEPIFFDVENGDYFPTVYALWKVPSLLPPIFIHKPVFEYISNGADLMMPGVVIPPGGIRELGPITLGSKRSVFIHGSNIPVAVGTMDRGSISSERKGKAMKIFHFYTDFLWRCGSKEHPRNFQITQNNEEHEEQEGTTNQINEPKEENADKFQSEIAAPPEEKEVPPNQKEEQSDTSPSTLLTPTDQEESSEEETETKSRKKERNPKRRNERTTVDAALVQKTDEALFNNFLHAIKKSIKDEQLPMLPTTLFTKFVADKNVDVKLSSYKKVARFIDEMEKKELLFLEESKDHKGIKVVTRINRLHPDYASFRPTKKEEPVPQEPPTSLNNNEEHIEKLDVLELFQPKKAQYPIFLAAGHACSEMFMRTECVEVLWKYVGIKNLTPKEKPTHVEVDLVLREALASGKEEIPRFLSKKELAIKFVSRLQIVHQVTRGMETFTKKGELEKLKLKAEMKQGRKSVTVEGLEAYFIDPATLARELRILFAAATTTSPVPAKPQLQKLFIQGNVLKPLTELMTSKYGVPQRYIDVTDAIKSKK